MFNKLTNLFLLLVVTASVLIAQKLPSEMYFSEDGRYLYTGGKEATGLYTMNLPFVK